MIKGVKMLDLAQSDIGCIKYELFMYAKRDKALCSTKW